MDEVEHNNNLIVKNDKNYVVVKVKNQKIPC